MKGMAKSIIVLAAICAIISLLLAAVDQLTAPIIEKNNNAAANAALLEVMPEGKNFKAVDLSSYKLPATVTEAYSEDGGGFVFRLTTTGYASGFVIMCGVNSDLTVSGALCLSSGETLGYEKSYGGNFTGKDSTGVSGVDTISGATKTTGAYKSAVIDAINSAIILGGGSVDIRTEEEILAENLNTALPAAEGKFSKVFLTEKTEAVTAVYRADNGSGYVCVVGEAFIGVDKNGTVTGSADHDIAAKVTAELDTVKASVLETLDITALDGIHENITAISKTATGNYVIDIKAAGFGIKGPSEYYPSGKYIEIKVAFTADGKIIDCLTVSQAESKGYGAACADDDFYSQFTGKTESDYTSIDAISGATVTTDAYKGAIGRAFEALKILTGGTNNAE